MPRAISPTRNRTILTPRAAVGQRQRGKTRAVLQERIGAVLEQDLDVRQVVGGGGVHQCCSAVELVLREDDLGVDRRAAREERTDERFRALGDRRVQRCLAHVIRRGHARTRRNQCFDDRDVSGFDGSKWRRAIVPLRDGVEGHVGLDQRQGFFGVALVDRRRELGQRAVLEEADHSGTFYWRVQTLQNLTIKPAEALAKSRRPRRSTPSEISISIRPKVRM